MDKSLLIKRALEIAKNRRIFYLVESGSRLWGFESRNSDYDLRGFFIYDKNLEFSLKKDNYFEYLNKSEQFDLVLFHLDKAFNLLSKSNPSVIEWLIATEDDVYFDDLNLREWFNEEIKNLINLRALFYHYYNLAKSNWQKYFLNQNKPTYKKVLYVLRGLLAANYILNYESIPPIKFLDLAKRVLDKELYEKVEEIVRVKKEGSENMIFNENEILSFISDLFEELSSKGQNVPINDERVLFEKVNKKTVEIKKRFLC